MLNKYLDYFFVFILITSIFIPEMGVTDITDIQFLYLSVTQPLIFTYLFILKKNQELISKIWNNKIIKTYFLFILVCAISIITAFNQTEAVVDFLYFFIVFITVLNYSYIYLNNSNSVKLFLFFIFSFLVLESLYTFKIFLTNYSFQTGLGRIRELQGFSYNQNINAFSLAIKLPILIYLIIKTRHRLFYIFSLFLFLITTFNLLVIGSRGAIIAYFLVLVISILFLVINHNKVPKSRRILIVLSLSLFSIITQNLLYQNKSELKSTNRITNFQDNSINYRKNLYLEALQGIKDYPLTGVGIGNWKILSIKYSKDRIKSYQVPYHAHNDFLHIGAETGLIGFFIYGLIFLIVLYSLFKLIKQKQNFLLYFFLSLSIFVYILDSSINFPRARVYSQVNLILLLGFIISSSADIKNLQKISFKNLNYLILIILPFTTYVGYKVYDSSVIQKKIIYDFNENPTNYKVPITEIEQIDPDIPTISNVCFPLKISLAFYQLQERDYEKAFNNAIESNKYNPFLGLSEHILAKIYLDYDKKRNIDSAYKYAKISHQKLPLNSAHNTIYQMVLAKMNKFEESKNVFNVAKGEKNEIVWQNYLIFSTLYKFNNALEYDDIDRKTVKEALSLFPKNEIIKQCDKIINYGEGLILIANEFDLKAIEAFKNNDFESAIDNWKQAIDIIDDDDSYYLNIAQSYLSMQNLSEAFETLKQVKENDLIGNDGKYEFLMGMYYYSMKNELKACNYFAHSYSLGNMDARKVLDSLSCGKLL